MQSLFRALALTALLAPLAGAQSLSHVRVSAPDAQALAATLESEGFDVIEGSVRANTLDLVVSERSEALLEARGLELELIAVSRPFREIQRERMAALPPDAVPAGYSDLADVIARMNAAAAANPTLAEVVDLTAKYGTPATQEGRHLYAIKISDNVTVDEDEPNALLVSDHHAREIVTPEIALTAMDNLLAGYGSDPTITALVDGHEIWIAPVWNPDGYEYVFNTYNLWRKNRRVSGGGNFGVDLNRNYPFLWTTGCSGSTFPGSDIYKGPSAGSEPETQTMVAFSEDRHFARVVDYHSYGREVLWAYASCSFHPFGAVFLQPEAIALSNASGYNGKNRPPSADGEHYQWQLGNFLNAAFLVETATSFQPSYATAQSEASLLFPGFLYLLQRPMPISGHVTDANSGLPLEATIEVQPINFQQGETSSSGGAFGRYTAFVPPGSYTLEVSADCYQSQSVAVTAVAGVATVQDIALQPGGTPQTYCAGKLSSTFTVPQIGWTGSASQGVNDLVITLSDAVANKNGIVFWGPQQASNPFQGGTLCVGGQVTRGPLSITSAGGTASYAVNITIAMIGTTRNYQWWFRDPPAPFGSGLSNALEVVFCP